MGESMTERSVRIAINIKNPVAQQLAYEMFSTAGAQIDVFDDVAAIIANADTVQAVVLGLDAFAEDTFEALALLRERLPATPVYVISAAAGQRHTERAELYGATQVIPYSELKLRVGPLVQEIAQRSGILDLGIRSPGWMPPSGDQGYDVESMDLNTWLSIPGNRRLLGMKEDSESAESTSAPAEDSESGDDRGGDGPGTVATSDTATIANRDAQSASIGVPPPGEAVDGIGWEQIQQFRTRRNSQSVATLDAHLQHEEHLRAELRGEFLQAITRRVATSEANMLDHLDERLLKAMRDNAAAIRQLKLMVGFLAGASALLVLAAIGVVWRLGIF
jgi:CheY-like chemotaxis protein